VITLRNKIGQMLIMGFEGSEINDSSPVAQWLKQDGLGGVLLFDKELSTGCIGKNLKNQTQIKQLNKNLDEYHALSPNYEESHPLFIAIDYEGGSVDRLAYIEGCMPTMTASKLARLSEEDFIEEVSQMAHTLKSLGFNLNFAPVVDLNLNHEEGIIGYLDRSFSSDPIVVTRLAKQFVDVFKEYGIATCYKHFPGHGSAVGDTHAGCVDVTDTYKHAELEPYDSLLKETYLPVMVMTAHVVNRCLDKSGTPATLSHAVLTGLLRNTMRYDGVVISDDLQMHAISHNYSLNESLRLTINAGADMVIFGNQLGNTSAPEAIDCIEYLVLKGDIALERIDDSYRRIMRLKSQIASASTSSMLK
jgi:beta-N-acetylhexosaminidase